MQSPVRWFGSFSSIMLGLVVCGFYFVHSVMHSYW